MADTAHGASGTVRARRAVSTPIRRLWFADRITSSLWFIPACAVVGAYLLSRLTVLADHQLGYDFGRGVLVPDSTAGLASVAATITAGMLTFLAIVFSTTLVAVQLAGSQYSPRIVRVFVSSRVTQCTLGVFLATLVFALNTLVGVHGGQGSSLALVVTGSVLYLLMLATIVMFVVFLHRIVRLLRVQYLFLTVTDVARAVVDVDFPTADAYMEAPLPAADSGAVAVIHHGRPGVVQAVDTGGLAALASQGAGWIELTVAVGENVGHGTRIAFVHGERPTVAADRVDRFLLIGGERSNRQDPAFGIRQLVDAASRVLSPAINDPTTAVQALHRIADLLAWIADRPDPTGWYADDGGVVRLRAPEDDFARLAALGFTEITRYGADAPQVVRCLRGIYDDLESTLSADRAAMIGRLRDLLDGAVADVMPAAFIEVSAVSDRIGIG